jgi:hypothetical protein
MKSKGQAQGRNGKMNSKIKRGENQEQGEAELSGKYVVMN